MTGEDADTLSEGDLDGDDASDETLDDEALDDEALDGTGAPEVEPDVESDVDPYDSPLTESIGDAIDADALSEAVEGGSDDADRR